MGADLYAEPVVRATYDEAGDVLGYDVAQVSFAGPLETLSRTDVTQPALLTNEHLNLLLDRAAGIIDQFLGDIRPAQRDGLMPRRRGQGCPPRHQLDHADGV